MSTTLLFVMLLAVIGLGFYLWQMRKTKKNIDNPDQTNSIQDTLRIDQVGAGGVIHLMNVGKQMEEYDVTILSKSVYREGENSEWYELEGDNGERKVWITLEHDDELEITIATRKLKLRDLPISRNDLDDMDEQGAGEFTFEGKTYYYENSNEASYFRGGDTSAENEEFFYYWEFETSDEDEFLTIEEWENGTTEVTISYPIRESQLKVYSTGGNQVNY